MNKFKRIHRGISIFMVATLLCTAVPMQGYQKIIFADTMASSIKTADVTVQLDPRSSSKFNNGEFQGWGTSLCWWANRIGGSDELTKQATEYFYNLDSGLGMNIGRYNIGGGDDPGHDHIRRSDSKVPGWAKDWEWMAHSAEADTIDDLADDMIEDAELVTDASIKLDLASTDSTFDVTGRNIRWNMDTTADYRQINVVEHAKEQAGDDFILEAFSNSPPYFMTNSWCSTGAHTAWEDNLRGDCYEDFAEYITQVARYFKDELNIPFQSISPMNEPDTAYWGANSNKQEGCHFWPGESQSRIINTLKNRLNEEGLQDIIIAGTDETSVDKQISSYNALDWEAQSTIGRIDTHTYSGSTYDRVSLRTLAERDDKNLWMSEVDGGDIAGDWAGEMGAALALGGRITTDMNALMPSAWILWNAIDNHIDQYNEFKDQSDCDRSEMINTNDGYWGIAVADHDNDKIILTKKYYAYGQYSKYIRPGYTIITSGDNTVAAYDKEGKKAVIVAMNTSGEDMVYDFDLSHFTDMGSQIEVIRTSGDMETGENWAERPDSIISRDMEKRNFQATLKGNSITTYIINDVVYDESNDLKEIKLDGSMVTGSEPWGNNSEHGVSKVVDGDISTFFDGVENGHVTIDLEKTHDINAISYAAREGFPDRVLNASFYGSDDGENWDKIYTIENTPSSTNYHYIYSDEMENIAYRYIKYAVPEGNEDALCNIAEIKLYGEVIADAYKDTTVYPDYVERNSLDNLPLELELSRAGETINIPVDSWRVTSGDLNNLNGSSVTVTATLSESVAGYGKIVSKELPVISTKLQYFIDCGAKSLETASEVYRLISTNVDGLKNKDIPDQAYEETSKWGYMADSIGGEVGQGNGTGLNATGYYGNIDKGKEVTYKLKLDAGDYEFLSGHYEWWNTQKRVTKVNISYEIEGELTEKTLGSVYFDGSYRSEGTVNNTFVVPSDDTIVTIKFAKGPDSSEDGVVSYFAIDKLDAVGDWFKGALERYKLTADQRKLYSRQSLDRYDEAYNHAIKVAEDTISDDSNEERIMSNLSKVIRKYESLQKKNAPTNYTSFSGTDGDTWYDTEGVEIQAHGGQVIKFGDTWYWYGEDKTDGYRTVDGGVRVYSSTDLYNWTEEGVALRNLTDEYDFEEEYFADLYKDYSEEQRKQVLLAINDSTSVIERPKVIYNEKTDKYVMWFHADGPVDDPNVPDWENHNYYASCAGVAVSDSPVGPFRFIERSRLNYVEGKHPWNPGEGMARDMNLFVDDDGTGYILYSSEGNATLIISKLNDEYTGLYKTNEEGAREGIDFIRSGCFVGQNREAPAIFKYNEKYYIMTSGCTGWGANEAAYAVADSILGTWENKGDPCREDKGICKFGSDSTFATQSTCVFAVNEGGYNGYIYMGDRWNNSDWPKDNNLYYPTYVWLPVEFSESGDMIIRPKNDWKLDDINGLGYSVKDNTKYPEYISSLSEMPDVLEIVSSGELQKPPVTWTVEKGSIEAKGSMVTLIGQYKDPEGTERRVTKELFVMSKNLEYFIDAGSLSEGSDTEGSRVYDMLSSLKTLKNKVADQEYSDDNGWGYVAGSYDGVQNGQGRLGLDASGYYGSNDGENNVRYKVTLDEGTYRISSGHYEWWWSGRTTDVKVSYNDEEKLISSVKLGGYGDKGTATGTFTVPEDNTVVTITFAKNTVSEGAGVVSYFAINNETLEEPEQPELKIKEFKEVQVETIAGTAPKLPEQVDVVYSDDTIGKAPVEWDVIPEDKYSIVGTFEVGGAVEGTDLKAKAVVTVEKAEEPEQPKLTIKKVKQVQVETIAGTAPRLPGQVEVVYSDNTIGKVPVKWDVIPEDKYSIVGTFEVEGTIEGTDLKAKAAVTVKRKESSGGGGSNSGGSSGGGGSSNSGKDTTKPKPDPIEVDNSVNVEKPSEKKLEKVSIFLSSGIASDGIGKLELFVKPYIQDGRTMVGVRDIATLLNVDRKDIIWNGPNQEVLIKIDDKEIKFIIGQKYVIVNGEKIVLDIAPQIKNGRTVIPIAHLAKILEMKIEFISETKEVILDLRR